MLATTADRGERQGSTPSTEVGVGDKLNGARMASRVIHGDCIEAMRAMPESSIDAIVTDPPYGLGFMGREWDSLPPGREWADECLRVLKPGGHVLAFGGTRTYHRLTCALEDAGFEIRDCLAWLYGSGFPKSLDVSKAIDKAAGAEREIVGRYQPPNGKAWNLTADESRPGDGGTMGEHKRRSEAMDITAPATPDAEQWQGWGTALKPAHEPIVMARKPLSGTVAANVLAHGTGALNVDGCRIEAREGDYGHPGNDGIEDNRSVYGKYAHGNQMPPHDHGRWPANVVLDPDAAAILDEQTGECRSAGQHPGSTPNGGYGGYAGADIQGPLYADTGGASRFFYVAKASSAERNAGLDGFEAGTTDDGRHTSIDNPYLRGETGRRNVHPTVKPIDLMRWLCRLITPPHGTILDPFTGSGTTGCAATLEGFHFTGIEREAEYVALADARIEWWSQFDPGTDTDAALDAGRERDEVADTGQLSLDG